MNKQEEVKFTQSGFLKIDGKKRVSVRFERGSDIAEGMLPPGKITKNHGFSDKEVAGLEVYLEMNCASYVFASRSPESLSLIHI